MSRRDHVAALLRSRPNQWVSVYDLELVGGRFAWRTRVSECRTQLGMEIRERCKVLPNGVREPHRMYVPPPPAEPAQAELFAEAM